MSVESMYSRKLIDHMRGIAIDERDQVSHCLWQMWRFAHQANNGKTFREGQFCYNMGRVQEILKANILEAWWRLFEPLIIGRDYATILVRVREYHDMLRIEYPSKEFIDK